MVRYTGDGGTIRLKLPLCSDSLLLQQSPTKVIDLKSAGLKALTEKKEKMTIFVFSFTTHRPIRLAKRDAG